MAGTKNNTTYSAGYNLEPTTTADTVTMQLAPSSTQTINVPSNPEGVFAANPGSIAEGRNGTLWLKVTGTGNTGWQQISTGTQVPIQFTSDFGVAIPSANNLNVAGFGTQGIYTLGSGDTLIVNAYDATSTQKGVASFNAINFTSTSGAITSNPITVNAGTGLSGGGSVNLGGSITLNALASVPLQFTADSGVSTPSANNENILGQQAGSIPVMYTNGASDSLRIENRTWETPYVIDASSTVGLRGTYTTIAAAQTAAIAAGATNPVYLIRSDITEDVTLTLACSIKGSVAASRGDNPYNINGKITIASSISVNFSNLEIRTNADYFLNLSNTTSSVTYDNCILRAENNDGILASSPSFANVYFDNCYFLVGNGFRLGAFTNVLAWFTQGFAERSGTPLATTFTNSTCHIINGRYDIPFQSLTDGAFVIKGAQFGVAQTPYSNITFITHNSTTATCFISESSIYSGTASCISIGANAVVEAYDLVLNSSNTNVITGSGILKYASLIFSGSSLGVNVTTQQGGLLQGGRVQNPSAGYIGEVIQSAATNVACTNSTATNITSISLTPGIWNISINVQASNTGANIVRVFGGISTTSATLTGNKGDQQIQNGAGAAAFDMSCTLADYRVVNTATTTYYLVGRQDFGAGTGTLNGRITATRSG